MARETSTEGGRVVTLFRSLDFEGELLVRFFRYQSLSFDTTEVLGDSDGDDDCWPEGTEIFSKSSGVIRGVGDIVCAESRS